jgi:hypothetical protein
MILRRVLVFSGTLCAIALLLILFFYPSVPQPSGARYFFSYGSPAKYIGSAGYSKFPYSIVTQRLVTVCIVDFEIDWIPENGIYLTIHVGTRNSTGAPLPWLDKTWRYAFYKTTQLPYNKTIPLTISISDSAFEIPIGETYARLQLSTMVDVIKPSGETASADGGNILEENIVLLSEHPLVAFFTTNAFGIGFGLLLAGISIAIIEAVADVLERRKNGDKEGIP